MTIQYDRSKPYNNLPLLPPSDDKVISINVLQQVNHANRALAELKGFAKKLPNQSMLVNTISLREAKASTEIENIFTTDDELYKALSGNEVKLNPNAKEVLRYRQALWKGVHDIRENGHFNLSIIINIYQQIKEVNDSIRPPQTETTIRRRGSGLLGGSVIYTPPRGEDLIEKMLLNLKLTNTM